MSSIEKSKGAHGNGKKGIEVKWRRCTWSKGQISVYGTFKAGKKYTTLGVTREPGASE